MADIANPSPHSCGLLSTVFQTVTTNLSEFTHEVRRKWLLLVEEPLLSAGQNKCVYTIPAPWESQG